MDKWFRFIGKVKEVNFKLFNYKHNSVKATNYKLFKNYNEIQNVITLKPPSVLTYCLVELYWIYFE